MHVIVLLENCEGRDLMSRRLAGDLMTADGIERAEVATSAARPGDKGVVEEIGAVAVTLLSSGGAEFLFASLRSLYPQLVASGPSDAGIRVKVDDTEIEISGPMSSSQFDANVERAFRIVEARLTDDSA